MASIELRTPKNKPAYYKITASITLNGQTIRKFSRFEFDPKTLKTAKQRVAAATAAAFEFEAKAQEEAERSLSGANKPFQEVAEEYIASAKTKLEPAALLRGNYDSDKNKANTTLNKVGYLKKIVSVAPWFAKKSVSEITREDCARVIEEIKEKGCLRSEYAFILPEYAARQSREKRQKWFQISSVFLYAMRSVLSATRDPCLKRQFGNMCSSPIKCCTLQMSAITRCKPNSRCRRKEHAPDL